MKTESIAKAGYFGGSLVSLAVAVLVSGCSGAAESSGAAENNSSGPVPTKVEELADGTTHFQYEGVETEASSASSSELVEKKNCVYIDYCRAPGDGYIICRSRDCSCTYQEATDECFRDARAVCGNSYYMHAYICGR